MAQLINRRVGAGPGLSQGSDARVSQQILLKTRQRRGVRNPCAGSPKERRTYRKWLNSASAPRHTTTMLTQGGAHSTLLLSLISDFCSSARRFALGLPSDPPSRDCPCRRLVFTLVNMIDVPSSDRGLSPHKFMPMPGVHQPVERTPSCCALRRRSPARWASLRPRLQCRVK